uniref:ZnMc domain-containing protein n=1 Tax=Strongyloides venezuelensis TaxID=75913 RepID=A0A0K0FGH2_STRVS
MKWILSILSIVLLLLCILDNGFATYNPTSQPPPYFYKLKIIKYYITERSQYTESVLNYIRFFDNNTCITFQRMDKPLKKSIGINFYISTKNDIILSHTRTYPTKVYFNRKEKVNQKLVRFYIGLALGLIPECTRKDRSQFVTTFFGNVLNSYKPYYKMLNEYNVSYYTTGFDFSSSMLVSPTFGSKYNSKNTYISRLYPYYEDSFRLFDNFSFNDAKRVNNMFCGRVCNKPSYCVNGGYLAKDCTNCRCTYPFTSKKCQDYEKQGKYCGSIDKYFASSKLQTAKIEGVNGRCYYFIKSKSKKKIEFLISKLKFDNKNTFDSRYCLEVKYQQDKGARGLTFCKDVQNVKLPALSDEILIIFNSYDIDNRMEFTYKEVSSTGSKS